jgi:hypothetical protein
VQLAAVAHERLEHRGVEAEGQRVMNYEQ